MVNEMMNKVASDTNAALIEYAKDNPDLNIAIGKSVMVDGTDEDVTNGITEGIMKLN